MKVEFTSVIESRPLFTQSCNQIVILFQINKLASRDYIFVSCLSNLFNFI